MDRNYSNETSNEDSINSQLSIQNENEHSVKAKLGAIDLMYTDMYKEMLNYRDDLLRLKKEKDDFQEDLQKLTKGDKNTLVKDLDKVMIEMEKHFEQQKDENKKLQLKIAKMKTSKTVLQGQLIALQRRITDLEIQVGNDEVKYN